MNRFVVIVVSLLLSLNVFAADETLAQLFVKNNIEGTIVLSSMNSQQTFIHNYQRSKQRFATASTFKILNTLIALEEKIVVAKTDVLKWDGRTYSFADWNQDQTLETAFKVSCVWCYQELATKVGSEKYRMYLNKVGYGLLKEPFETTTFWLDGSLQITALEQVDFLKKIYQRKLPFSENSYEVLKEIMLLEKGNGFSIWAKTGWAARSKPQIGWFVGYVETATDVWFFATNIDINSEKDLPFRRQLTMDVLRAKTIIN